jgi:hypothetical protein
LKLVQEALVALENISTALREEDVLGSDIELMLNTIAAIHKALAQPEQEPSYWLGYGLQAHTEKPFDDATPLYTTTPQRQLEERNFCSRCGKRLGLGGIHTCTPPRENT